MNSWVYLIAGMILVGLVLFSTRERFQPEFLDKSQVQKTVAVQNSSYEQRTNHLEPSPYSIGPATGIETPFQVNQYRAFV
jgi:hypothetical protein